MKKAIFIFFILMIIFTIAGCSKSKPYRDDVACDDIADGIRLAVPSESGYSQYGEDRLEFFFENTTLPDDYSLCYSAEVNDIDEFGVFHCPDKDSAKALCDIVTRYIEEQQTNQTPFIASYAPREVPKLEGAEVRQYGNYVIYAIFDDTDKNEIFDEIEKAIALQ